VLTLLTERHRPLTGKPGGKLLVCLDETVCTHAQDNGAQLVNDFVSAIRLVRDLRIQADQSLAEVILDENFVRLAREVLTCQVVPAESGELAPVSGETRAYRRVVDGRTAESVADQRLHGFGFVEGHH
jgi:hypothetical protein